MTDPADHPARLTKASDLPPEISTLIETAIAQEAGLAPRRRPLVATRFQAVQDTSLRLPHLRVPEKGTRVLALEGPGAHQPLRWAPPDCVGQPFDRHQHGPGRRAHDDDLHRAG